MSQAATPNAEQPDVRLLEQLTHSSRTYLELAERLAATPRGSDEYDALEGELYARINQLRFDADDVIEAFDADLLGVE